MVEQLLKPWARSDPGETAGDLEARWTSRALGWLFVSSRRKRCLKNACIGQKKSRRRIDSGQGDTAEANRSVSGGIEMRLSYPWVAPQISWTMRCAYIRLRRISTTTRAVAGGPAGAKFGSGVGHGPRPIAAADRAPSVRPGFTGRGPATEQGTGSWGLA